jgi:hypothetical protein
VIHVRKPYAAPKVTAQGDVKALTRGEPWPIEFDDSTYFWGDTPRETGSGTE